MEKQFFSQTNLKKFPVQFYQQYPSIKKLIRYLTLENRNTIWIFN